MEVIYICERRFMMNSKELEKTIRRALRKRDTGWLIVSLLLSGIVNLTMKAMWDNMTSRTEEDAE